MSRLYFRKEQMITRSRCAVQIIGSDRSLTEHAPSWAQQLKNALRDPHQLLDYLGLDASLLPGAQSGHALFPIRVPLAYAQRIQPGNPHDPLLKQVLPVTQESDAIAGFVHDPLDEAAHRPRPGLIHKYKSRVLLITSGGCAINCRYCFRRHFPYSDNTPSRAQWLETLDYIRARPEINEVILSGGDPLASSDARLSWLIEQLEAIPQLIRLRIHTRLPIVIPDRVDAALLDWLQQTRLQKVMVVHVNHANELDDNVNQAMTKLQHAGVTLLNQSVLMRGINDDVTSLATLSERLFANGILPYYLHVLDPVQGAAHFDVADQHAVTLIDALRVQLAGFLVPRLVREIPGELSKTPLPRTTTHVQR